MALFNKTQQQMVLDLIISENPGLAGATLATVEFVGTPTVVSGATTTAKLRGKRGGGFTGVQSFTYTRLDLGRLFFNVTIGTLYVYSANQTTDLLPVFNARFGLNLTASDIANSVWGSAATGQNVIINAGTANSLVYYGSTPTFRWERGSQLLTDYYPKTTLSSLTVPDLMIKAFQIDFSASQATLEAHDTTVAFSSASSTAQAIVDLLVAKTGLPVTLGATTTPGSGLYDLSGFTLKRSTPDIIQDSNPGYRKVAVLTPPSVFGNQYTPIYLHYDKIPVFVKTKTSDVVSVTELPGLVAPTK